MVFQDLHDAGRQVAQSMTNLKEERPLVFALSQDSIPVAYEVARSLQAPLDLVIQRKVIVLGQTIFEGKAARPVDILILNEDAGHYLRLMQAPLQQGASSEMADAIEQGIRHFRSDRPMSDIRGRTVILVDTGLLPEAELMEAVQSIRRIGPRKLILAMPVGARELVEAMRPQVSDLICLGVSVGPELRQRYAGYETPSPERVEILIKLSRGHAYA